MDQLLNKNIYKFKQTNIINNSKILLSSNLNKKINYKLINFIKLEYILKGLNKYHNNLILYLSSFTSNYSIISYNNSNYYTSKDTLSQSKLQVLPSFLQYKNLILNLKKINNSNKYNNEKSNININIKEKKKEKTKLENNDINIKNKHDTYLELININNVTNKNNI